MMQIFKVGDEIGGYCGGFFGRNDYENKTCMLVAPKYAVFEYWETGRAAVLNLSEELVESGCDTWRIGETCFASPQERVDKASRKVSEIEEEIKHLVTKKEWIPLQLNNQLEKAKAYLNYERNYLEQYKLALLKTE